MVAKYLVQASYTAEGLAGLLKEGGTGRRQNIDAMIDKAGGTVEAFYFAFGTHDLVALVDLPDNVSVASIALAAGASGAVRTNVTVLLTPAEVDDAVARQVGYRPPGS